MAPIIPIGVFWDIENCQVPKGKSALSIAQCIRDKFFGIHTEAEFMCVCDISKESRDVIEELNSAQVTVVHVNSTSKNAADDKIKQSLRRYANVHMSPATVLLMSGDVNFAAELFDLRYRHKLRVILVHSKQVPEALLACAHEHCSYEQLIADLPNKNNQKVAEAYSELLVSNLPINHSVGLLKVRLKQLSDNCGGRVMKINRTTATIRFPNVESATRAKKRMDGEDAYGCKIKVDFVENWKERESMTIEANSKDTESVKKNHAVTVSSPLKKHKGNNSDTSQIKKEKTPKEINNNNCNTNNNNDNDCNTTLDLSKPDIEDKGQISTPSQTVKDDPTKPVAVKKNKNKGQFRIKSPPKADATCNHCIRFKEDTTQRNEAEKDIYEGALVKKTDNEDISETKKAKPISPSHNDNVTPPKNSTKAKNTDLTRCHHDSENKKKKHPCHSNGSVGRDCHGDKSSTNSFSEALERISKSKSSLKDALKKVGSEERTTRTALFLQQQLYQEKQERCHSSSSSTASSCSTRIYSSNIWNTPHPTRGDCAANPAFQYGYKSPSASSPSQSCYSASPKSFRKTPGAKSAHPRYNRGCNQAPLDSTKLFQPMRNNSSIPLLTPSDLNNGLNAAPYSQDVPELMVSNLDYNISAREWKKILYTELQQQIKVLGVHIQAQPDGTNVGYVRVPTIDEARFAISQFHRKKIGYKRIHVSLVSSDLCSSAFSLRNEVIALLKEVTGNRLHLFKFIELFEKRFHRSISVSELYKLKDTVDIQDEVGAGRMVSLSSAIRNSPVNQDPNDEEVAEILESPVCKLHCHEGSELYMDAMDACILPNVHLQLRSFAAQVHTLLQTHNGDMPLMSFPSCYAAEFHPLTPLVSGGVPLEHLISNIPGVKIALSKCGIKKIQWAENKPPAFMEFSSRFVSSPLMTQQLAQFSREVVDLLKHSLQCRMPFSKFIPAYHHHFGRQCRVADYGYTKLMELFEAIPHVVQILGCGSRRFVTLSHRSQVKRFSSDLLRVLKSQPTKELTVLELAVAYNKVIGKQWDVTDYGVCYLEDMLTELPDTTVIVCGTGDDMTISIPRRYQTKDEMDRTRQFSLEVVDLLKHSPQGRMPFNKFIPAYHHHFGKQCRVADYGFMKLIELFEAIPHVIQISEEQEEKMLSLTEPQMMRVAAEQVTSLLASVPENQLAVDEFLGSFMRLNGHNLRLNDYNVSSVKELINKLKNIAKIEEKEGVELVILIDQVHLQQVAHRVLHLLMDTPEGSMSVKTLREKYQKAYACVLDVHEVATELKDIINVIGEEDSDSIKLCPLQMFARDIRTLLRRHNGRILLHMFETAYSQHFGVSLVPASYGYPNTMAMLLATPHIVTLQGKGQNKMVTMCEDFQGQMGNLLSHNDGCLSPDNCYDVSPHTPSNDSGITEPQDEEDHDLLQFHGTPHQYANHSRGPSPLDLLSAPLPSTVPSPELTPYPTSADRPDLIQFEAIPSTDILCTMSEEEKKAQCTPLCRTPVSDMLQFAASLLPNQQPGVIHTLPIMHQHYHQNTASPTLVNIGYGMPPQPTLDMMSQPIYQPHCVDVAQMPLPVFQDRAILSMVTGSPIQHATTMPSCMVPAMPPQSAAPIHLSSVGVVMPTIYTSHCNGTNCDVYSTVPSGGNSVKPGSVEKETSDAQSSSSDESRSHDLSSDPDQLLNQSTSSQKLTPRKCRIAAKFNVPIKAEEV